MRRPIYDEETIAAIVATAKAAVDARLAGRLVYTTETGHAMDLIHGGYCARFVREVHEVALGQKPYTWPYRAENAMQMEEKLRSDGYAVTDGSLIPGDIIGVGKYSQPHGHIALYIGAINGVPTMAENTSSSLRGKPLAKGTKYTPFKSLQSRVTGIYRLGPSPEERPDLGFTPILLLGNKSFTLEVAPGGDHRRDQKKVYFVQSDEVL